MIKNNIIAEASGAPKDRQAEPHTHDDDDDGYGGVAQDGGHPPNNRFTGT